MLGQSSQEIFRPGRDNMQQNTAARAVGVIVGGGALSEHLAQSSDVKALINSWVSANSLETPSCQAAHELLDSMGFSRAEQHKGIMLQLKERLL